MDIDLEILQCFLDEAADSVSEWERACLEFESSKNASCLDALFRSAHNLKGTSRGVGLEGFASVVHEVEDFIQGLRREEIPFNPEAVGFLLEAQVFLAEWIEELKRDRFYVANAKSLLAMGQEVKRGGATEGASGGPQAPAELDLEALFEQERLLYEHKQTQSHEPPKVEVSKVEVPELTPPKESSPEANVPRSDEARAPKADETVRVSAEKLDELIQLVGELSIHQSVVLQAKKTGTLGTPHAQKAVVLGSKITKELQGKALSLRMQPLHTLFQRLERTIRDVARRQGKQLQINMEGVEVELDRTVMEKMTEPLIHIVRNAVDHGIESSDERKASNKSGEATVSLIATQDAASVTLQISDDGKGLDPEKLRKKAIDKKLISANAVLSQEECFNLIFLPGFSTAEAVTDISGRGVGMDVVMKAVQTLRGSIRVESVLGKGTSFLISLPMSLSVMDAMIVKIEQSRYVVPMHELSEIIDVNSHSVESSGSKGRMLSLRGAVVPVEALGTFIKGTKGGGKKGVAKERAPALIVKDSEQMIAFEVDSIIGQQQVVVRPLTEKLSKVPGLAGCTILADGEPSMIVDLPRLARLYFKEYRKEIVQ